MEHLPFTLPMKKADIEKIIPHRFPFLFVDEVTELIPHEYIVGTRTLDPNDQVFQGHFPGNPILPGVHMVEGMAQISAVLGQVSTVPPGTYCLLLEVSSARFRQIVRPSDKITYKVKLTNRRKNFFWFHGETYLGDQLAAEADFSAKLG